jgi:glycerate kinase
MRILICPDKFKDSLSAEQVCTAIGKGLFNINPHLNFTKIPLADGGDGSLSALQSTLKFEKIYVKVNNPLFNNIKVFYGMLNKTAYIELAAASGLQLLKNNERNVMFTSTFGTGELIKDAVTKGCNKINLFVGGSATNDFGIGIAAALGYKFFDENNIELKPIGKNLIRIKSIDASNVIKLKKVRINVLTDVNNFLYGKNGAAFVFAKQKGAKPNDIIELDKGLKNISKLAKSEFDKDVSKLIGGGAAGGVAAGLSVFCNAEIKSGIRTIMDLLHVDNQIKKSDFIITGEGKLDRQTLEGKVVKGIMDLCKKYNKPLGIVCGVSTLTKDENSKIDAIIKPIKTRKISKENSLKNAYQYLIERSEELLNDFIKKNLI